jgi:hypothetical protein
VDRALWLSLERDINHFRINVLGLEPLRMGQGAWNLLNIHQVTLFNGVKSDKIISLNRYFDRFHL